MKTRNCVINNIRESGIFSEYQDARIYNAFPQVIDPSGFNIFEYDDVFNDEKTNELIRNGRTIGCFYIESPGMRSLLQKLDCHTFEMLTAASSIIRPGVAESGMMKEFIERHKNPARRKYIIPEMEEYLSETYGVMVYQEDVIKIVHHIAGMALEEADLLRCAMSGRVRSYKTMRIMENRFYDSCRGKKLTEDATQRLWREIVSFAGYAFCKAHSASFAVLSYQVAYLKAHYPAEFMTSVLNNGGGYYSPAIYIYECRRMGVEVLLPDINKSEYKYQAQDGKIRIGLMAISILEAEQAGNIVKERNLRGKYKSLTDLLNRMELEFEQAEALIRCGALDCFNQTRPTLLRLADTYFFNKNFMITPNMDLFAGGNPKLDKEIITGCELSYEDKCTGEYKTLGYMVSEHPLNFFGRVKKNGFIKAADMKKYHNKRIKIMGWYMASKRVTTSKGKVMKFLSLEDTTGTFEAVLFPETYGKYADLTAFMGPYVIEGKVDVYNGNNIIVDKMTVLSQEKAKSSTQRERTNKDFFGDTERPLREEEMHLINSLGEEKLLKAYV